MTAIGYMYSPVGVVLVTLALTTSVSGHFEITVPIEPQLAVFGHFMVLSCSFPVGPGSLDSASLIVTWQRGLEVVHSFYHSQDQLDRQSRRYANRTHLYLSQLHQGNASLRLDNVSPEDTGYYSCSVSTMMGSQKKTFLVEFAAFYSEPHVQITVSRSGVELFLTSRGFPEATLEWHDQEGQNLANKTVTEVQVDPQGLYTISSRFTQGPAANTSLRFILRNPVLQQEMRRDLALSLAHEMVPQDHHRCRHLFYLSVVLFTVVLLLLLASLAHRTCCIAAKKGHVISKSLP
ncbi:CD276 antigen-like [Brienomyrus brachyistius]|uniref:CD276 antigen-like n=1 Tax=Brienomyrus brachyistius TaxID=42636 RepID=UPI0020B1903F|nr:CD276 antigen-like [Brienomyrus brachyistius]